MPGLQRKIELARKLLSHPLLDEFLEAGFLNDMLIRNCRICSDYKGLRSKFNHIDSVQQLSEKYFLSKERILSILYK